MFNFTCGAGGGQPMGFARLPQTDFWGSDLSLIQSTSVDACMASCLDLCNCVAFEYKHDTNDCYLKSALFNGKTYPGYPGTVYLKLPARLVPESQNYTASKAEVLVCDASDVRTKVLSFQSAAPSDRNTTWRYYYGFLSAFFAVELCFIAFGWWFTARSRPAPSEKWAAEEGYRVVTDHFRRFTYKELRKATRRFKDEIGHGRYGSVYKGVLDDGRVVAVKKLKDMARQGGDEFQTEVSVIGRIYHMNLVRICGVCSEHKRRLLVYEYVEKGSLAMPLFGAGAQGTLSWDQRYSIAIGVAKGLAYLHHECLDWIIHCDVKPENILLDKDFEPKISDFGLAKLQRRDQADPDSCKIRGTRGYMAPEWVSSLPITEKVDVYSYGVVLLELVRGVRMDSIGETEAALRRLVWTIRDKLKSSDRSWIAGFVDPRLNGDFTYPQVALVLEVATSCLEKERSQRPTMNHVLQKFLLPHDEIKFVRDKSCK